jgi:hypothetical protein
MERRCHAVEWASLAHINRLATETQSRITKEWIQEEGRAAQGEAEGKRRETECCFFVSRREVD